MKTIVKSVAVGFVLFIIVLIAGLGFSNILFAPRLIDTPVDLQKWINQDELPYYMGNKICYYDYHDGNMMTRWFNTTVWYDNITAVRTLYNSTTEKWTTFNRHFDKIKFINLTDNDRLDSNQTQFDISQTDLEELCQSFRETVDIIITNGIPITLEEYLVEEIELDTNSFVSRIPSIYTVYYGMQNVYIYIGYFNEGIIMSVRHYKGKLSIEYENENGIIHHSIPSWNWMAGVATYNVTWGNIKTERYYFLKLDNLEQVFAQPYFITLNSTLRQYLA
ncbi:MAG: hypothetical protein ACFFB5_12630 [Promethearchaeota archaeon]